MCKHKEVKHQYKRLLYSVALLLLLLYTYFAFSHTAFTPRQAFEKSERSALYGPSYIVHEERQGSVHYFLGYYDKWFSCHPTVKTPFGIWRPGNQVYGQEMDKSKPFNFSVGYSRYNNEHYFSVFGIVHDPSITKIQLHLTLEGVPIVLQQENLYENMFLFTLDGKDYDFDKIVGMTDTDEVIYEETR